MKTKELIALLQNEDQEAEVAICAIRDTVLGTPYEPLATFKSGDLGGMVVITCECENPEGV